MASKNCYLSDQIEGGVARGSHRCKKFYGQDVVIMQAVAMNKSPVIASIKARSRVLITSGT